MLRIDSRADKINPRAEIRCLHAMTALLLSLLVICFLVVLSGDPAVAASNVLFKSIAQLTVDDDGRKLKFPADVFFDPVEENIYLIEGYYK